jgi:hypothetical protein
MDLFEYILETMNYNLYTDEYLFENIDMKKLGSAVKSYYNKLKTYLIKKIQDVFSAFKNFFKKNKSNNNNENSKESEKEIYTIDMNFVEKQYVEARTLIINFYNDTKDIVKEQNKEQLNSEHENVIKQLDEIISREKQFVKVSEENYRKSDTLESKIVNETKGLLALIETSVSEAVDQKDEYGAYGPNGEQLNRSFAIAFRKKSSYQINKLYSYVISLVNLRRSGQ